MAARVIARLAMNSAPQAPLRDVGEAPAGRPRSSAAAAPRQDADIPKPDYWDEATTYLVERDRILRRLIPEQGAWLQPSAPPVAMLARALLGQQVSVTTAESAWRRLTDACGRLPTPQTVLRQAERDSTLAGLPARKASYLLDLATQFAEKRIRPAVWSHMDDEAVIAELRGVRGIGRWTAEMFLIFSLRRPDVLPLDDPSLLKAISLHYFSGEPVSRFEAREVAQAWAPWRSVASWYLWRSLDQEAAPYQGRESRAT